MAIYISFLQDKHNKKHYRNMMSRASRMQKLIIYDSNFCKARSSDYARKVWNKDRKIMRQRWNEGCCKSKRNFLRISEIWNSNSANLITKFQDQLVHASRLVLWESSFFVQAIYVKFSCIYHFSSFHLFLALTKTQKKSLNCQTQHSTFHPIRHSNFCRRSQANDS